MIGLRRHLYVRWITVALGVMFAAHANGEGACPPPPWRAPWPVAHADTANSDFVPYAGPRRLREKWRALQVRSVAAAVTIGPGNRLYTVTMDEGPAHLHALDGDGSVLWSAPEVRAAFTTPSVGYDGSIYVTDGTEVFGFRPNGTIRWRVPATGPALGILFTRDGALIVIDAGAVATVYSPENGEVLATLSLPAGVIPRPKPLPLGLSLLKAGSGAVGIDPDLIDFFIDAWSNYNTAVGNNVPVVHPDTGRVFVAVTAEPNGERGALYGIDYTPPVGQSPGRLDIACSAQLGLASSTSPAISADRRRVYAGDSEGTITAFNSNDCSVAWRLAVEGDSPISPAVDSDGRFYALINGDVVGFRDAGDSAEQIWKADLADTFTLGTFQLARFNSVIAGASNYLYAAASFFVRLGASWVPMRHVLVTLDSKTGELVAMTELGEESNSQISLAADGMVVVASKALVKATLLGTPILKHLASPPQSGVFAFEPVGPYRPCERFGQ